MPDHHRLSRRTTNRLVYALAVVALTFILGLAVEGIHQALLATATVTVLCALVLFHIESGERSRAQPACPGCGARPGEQCTTATTVTTEISPGVFVTVVATPSGVAFEIEDQRHTAQGRFVATVMSDDAARRLAASLDAAIKERASKPWGVTR